MAHLGVDIAAYVDGQLPDATMRVASAHLDNCEACRQAVRQQRLLKSRMNTVASPEPPAALLASLAGLAAAPPQPESWWVRVRRSTPVRAGVVLLSASVAILVTAYAVGTPAPRGGGEVAPPFDRYAAEFWGTTTLQAGNVITDSTMDELNGSGWPCLGTLAGSLHRVSGALADRDEVVALGYSDGSAKLNLFEQRGSLDRKALGGFESTHLGGSQVWVREGSPVVVTWHDDGVVYTIVTDVDRERLSRAIAELPEADDDPGPAERVGDGITRMTAWLDAA